MALADPQVIVASADAEFHRALEAALAALRWPSVEAHGGADALNKLDSLAGIEAVIFDRSLPDLDVEDLDVSLRAHRADLDILLVDVRDEESCKTNRTPVHSRSKELIWKLARSGQAAPEPRFDPVTATSPRAAGEPDDRDWEPLPGMIGSAPGIAEVSRLVRLVAPRKTSVLITGETGTGKEVVAQAVHGLSPRAEEAFVAVNCAAIPDALLESELFGHARGAFAGAMQPRAGRIEAAHRGTLFLDEIGELPAALQAKLLRFLQEKEIQRLGSNEVVKLDVRIVAATHVNLLKPEAQRPFRPDLYYRLAVFPVDVPALRERREDIMPLARHFLADLCEKDGSAAKQIDDEVCAKLQKYDWPGNVRELQHLMERAYILSQDERVLTPKHLPALDPEKILNLT